jgi:hypothetical protein
MNKKEIGIMIQFFVGLLVAILMSIEYIFIKILILFGIGLLFELLTANFWKYCDDLINSFFCPAGAKINIIFPFGWLGLLLGAFALTKVFITYLLLPTYLSYFLGFMIIGSFSEILFFNLGYWTYNSDAVLFGTFKPLKNAIRFLGVPVQIMVEYGLIFGTLMFFLDKYLIKICGV